MPPPASLSSPLTVARRGRFDYRFWMGFAGKTEPKLDMAAKLALAQAAFAKYRVACFWFLREDLVVTEENLHLIIDGLRSDGDREAFQLAAKLCP